MNQLFYSPRGRHIQVRDREAIARRMICDFSCTDLYESYSNMDGGIEQSPGTGILNSLLNLFAPPQIPCLACGKVISERVRDYPELCASCFASIPWIRKPRCITCGRPVGCPDCSRPELPARSYLMNRSAVAYNKVMREWLAQYKYRGNEAYGVVLSRMMEQAYFSMIKELETLSRGERFRFDAVTFVPVSDDRLQERGFNQANHLAYGAAKAGRLPLLSLLERSRHTEKQSFKSRWERLNNLQDVFRPNDDAIERLSVALLENKYKGKRKGTLSSSKSLFTEANQDDVAVPVRLLLVDDIYTTGSTIEACAKVLHQLCTAIGRPAEVYSLTWARS
ncbi:ComF family protein [Paenibacillus puldeungensis]|uniref:ComF family protein n=1 Tax=Paenibacillus puldeungensis TaxID=696536 RepID=A0ABW3S269_9BACL